MRFFRSKDRDNRSPLTLAAVNGNEKIMELLLDNLEQKNLVNIPDRNGLNVVFYAIKAPNGLPILRLLVARKLANLAFVNKDKNTALHFSVIQKNYEAAELLLQAGALVDARNSDGRTPLMLAALAGDERLVRSLLRSGAEAGLRDQSGAAAADLCQSEQCLRLLSRGGDTEDSFSEATSSRPRLAKGKSEPSLRTQEEEEEEDTSQVNTEEKLAATKSRSEVNSWSESETTHSRTETALRQLKPSGSEGLSGVLDAVSDWTMLIFVFLSRVRPEGDRPPGQQR